MSFIFLAVEDELSAAVGRRIINETLGIGVEINVIRKNGFGYLKSKLPNFVQMSKNCAVLMITDLDSATCAPRLKEDWFGEIEQPKKFVFRVAVREVEAWLLADSSQLSAFLGVKQSAIPSDPQILADPKATLIRIAHKAKRELRLDIVPEVGAKSKQGIGYNRALCPFVTTNWDIQRAAQKSDSLKRACQRVAELAEQV